MGRAGSYFQGWETFRRPCDPCEYSATIQAPSQNTVQVFQPVVAVRDASNEYRKLVAALASRAIRMGSRDAEGAAQEALKRSLANPISRAAVDYYFQEHSPAGLGAPDWPLE